MSGQSGQKPNGPVASVQSATAPVPTDLLAKNGGVLTRYGVTPEDVRVYEVYIQRIMKHYDIGLLQFQLYLGFNTGLLIVLGYLFQEQLKKDLAAIPLTLSLVLLTLSVIGIVFALAWWLVNRDARKWQLIFNEVIGEVEDKLFVEPDRSFYQRINQTYPPNSKFRTDLIDFNVYMTWLFIALWVALATIGVIGCIYHSRPLAQPEVIGQAGNGGILKAGKGTF